jgi:hypothetical protein
VLSARIALVSLAKRAWEHRDANFSPHKERFRKEPTNENKAVKPIRKMKSGLMILVFTILIDFPRP